MARAALAAAALAAALVLAVPAALADGDPASDVLLFQKVFLPYTVKLPPASAAELKRIVAEANKREFTVRVALIADRTDLGSWPAFFGQPQKYASFLSQELYLVPGGAYKNRVLTVMPSGYGLSVNGKTNRRERRVLDALPTPTASGRDLAAAAAVAVQRLAAANGVKLDAKLPSAHGGGGGGGGGSWPLILGGVLTLLVLTTVLETFRRLRRRPAQTEAG